MKSMNFLIKNAPPGANILIHTNYYIAGLGCSGLWSLGFMLRFTDEYDRLLRITSSRRYVTGDYMMPEFEELLSGSMNGIFVIVLLLLVSVVMNYASFQQGSKSIYLMRRLPSRWELHRRCILLPALGIAGSLVVRTILLSIYFAVYMLVTPDRCLPPDQWQKFWSVLL